MAKIAIAYKLTCTISGKSYIGITIQALKSRWACHRSEAKYKRKNTRICAAINKYGPSAFLVEHIASARTLTDIKATEIILISQENTLAPNGYNLSSGGDGLGNPAEETRQKIAKAMTGRRLSDESRAKISAALTGKKIPPRSAEYRAKMSAATKGRTVSAATRALLSANAKIRGAAWNKQQELARRGKPFSAEQRATRSRISKAWWAARKASQPSGQGVLL